MSYVTIDSDEVIGDISTSDLVSEICDRLQNPHSKKQLTEHEITKLKWMYKKLGSRLSVASTPLIESKTLDDEMKIEHLSKIFSKYTWQQLEAMLPE